MNHLAPGRIVLYKLSKADCERIEHTRGDRVPREWNQSRPGDVVPAIVVHNWSQYHFNGQAFLDGPDTLWLASVQEGPGEGQWQWPVRE